MLGPFAFLLSPTSLIVMGIIAAIAYIHNDGDKRGYARHMAEINEAVREKNKAIGRTNDGVLATIDRRESERQVVIQEVVRTVEVPGPEQIIRVPGHCPPPPEIPAGVLAKLNKLQ